MAWLVQSYGGGGGSVCRSSDQVPCETGPAPTGPTGPIKLYRGHTVGLGTLTPIHIPSGTRHLALYLGAILCCPPPLFPLAPRAFQKAFSGHKVKECPPPGRAQHLSSPEPCPGRREAEPQATLDRPTYGPLTPTSRLSHPSSPTCPRPLCRSLMSSQTGNGTSWPFGPPARTVPPGPA